MCVCLCVCVCVNERERGEKLKPLRYKKPFSLYDRQWSGIIMAKKVREKATRRDLEREREREREREDKGKFIGH